jgi:hypothetical protein
MFSVTVGEYNLVCMPQGLPTIYAEYVKHARLADEINFGEAEGDICFLAVGKGSGWPFLVVAQIYSPTAEGGFHPGALLVPETGILFIGAGGRILAYELNGPRKLWEGTTDVGFWGWARHNEVVLMSAELELAAWDVHGRTLWSTFVEPPWSYEVVDGRVELDVMGKKSSFSISPGPPQPRV